MTDLRQAAQQALDALEGFAYHGKAAGWPETITALRAALAAPQPKPVGTAGDLFTYAALERFDLRPSTKVYITHPPEPQPDLQDLRYAAEKPLWEAALRQIDDDVFAAYAVPQPEPVAWMWRFEYDEGAAFSTKEPTISIRDGVNYVPLYTAPPPLQRQPLTEEQITEILGGYPAAVRRQLVLLVRAVEALHGIGGDK